MNVLIYIYTEKLSPRILWVLKFNVKLGSGGYKFRLYNMNVRFQKFGSKRVIFFSDYRFNNDFYAKLKKCVPDFYTMCVSFKYLFPNLSFFFRLPERIRKTV